MKPAASNAELLRLQYLQAMGITTYYPRVQLPGALPSQACEWPFSDKVVSATPASVPAAPAVARQTNNETGYDSAAAASPAAATAARPRAQSPAVAAPEPGMDTRPPSAPSRPSWQSEDHAGVAVPAPVPRAAGPGVAPHLTNQGPQTAGVHPEEALHFQLLLMQVDADLAVVVQIPALGRPQLQNRQQVLLGNMLRWLGKALPAEGAPRIFRWPLPGLTLTNTRREAGASLLHFLEQACVEQPFRHLLMLGEAAAECLQVHRDQAPAQTLAWQLTATHSLDELLALPQLKRAAWHTLLPLHAALSVRQSAPRA